jgi:transposase
MILHQNILGVDVAKDWIDICDLASGRIFRIGAKPRALKAFASKLPKDALIVFEASGGYERALMDALEAAGLAYARINPRQAREFARATGRLAKTDRVDARVLAEMGKALGLAPTPPVDPARRRLAELIARREDLVGAVTAETNRLHQAADPFVRRDIRSHLAVLRRRKLLLETEIAGHTRKHEALDALVRRIQTVPGFGPAIAPAIVAYLPELGALDRRAIASLGGLAPHACDSGQRRGKRQVWGGRAQVRRALYLAAFIASRCDPQLRAFRQRLFAAGKPIKLVLIAVARKLLTILNAMIRDGHDYQPRPA